MEEQPLLCYVDFTEITENLSKWVSYIYKNTNRKIDLIYADDHNTSLLFGKNYKQSDIENKLQDFRKRCSGPEGRNFIRKGCNCSVIGQLAEENNSLYTIIPVHKHRDVQYLSSKALVKSLRMSRIPCLAIPEKNKFKIPEKISISVNHRKDQKIVSPWVTHISQTMGIPVTLYFPKSKEKSIERNLHFIKKFIEGHSINTDIKNSNKGLLFTDKTAISENTEGIHFLHLSKNPGLIEKLFGDRDASLIDNQHGTPVFCVNSRDDIFVPCT